MQKQVQANVCVNMNMVKDALDQLRGAVMIVYPMGLPPYDPIRMEFEDKEDLSGTQVILYFVPWLQAIKMFPFLKCKVGTLWNIDLFNVHILIYSLFYTKGSEWLMQLYTYYTLKRKITYPWLVSLLEMRERAKLPASPLLIIDWD